MNRFRDAAVVAILLLCCGCEVSSSGFSFQRRVKPVPVVVPDDKIVGHEFRALIIEDVTARARLPKVQLAMLTAKEVRDFLKENCVKDDKGNPQFRIVDKTTELTGVWATVRSKGEPTSYPWIILVNGKSFVSKPLPQQWPEFKTDLETYAGVK